MSNLFILQNCLGDTILTTGVINLYKDEPMTLIMKGGVAPLFDDCPNVERLFILEKTPWRQDDIKIWNNLRKTSLNRIIDFKPSAFTFILKANEKRFWTRREQSTIHRLLQLSTWFGDQGPLPPKIVISKARLDRMKPTRPTLAIAPIPGWPDKQWPIENFITLLTKFCKTYPDAQVAVFAAPHEKDRVLPLLKALPKSQCIDTLGGHLLDTAALIKWSRVFIGNDSGLMHMSAAVGTPTIALFGPTDERIFGPWSGEIPSPHRVLRSCPLKDRKHSDMATLSVETVWEVLQDRWEDPDLRMSA